MNFAGTGAKLAPEDIARAAITIGCDVAAIRAVLSVEARGSGFDSKNRPVILFEPHVFYRNLSPAELPLAIERGLARKQWRSDYPASQDARYEQLARAMEIDDDAALKAASWGIGQVLGENHVAAGFGNVLDMVKAAMISEGMQLDQVVGFIITKGLDKHLRGASAATNSAERVRYFAAFARGYNGAGYKKNAYDKRLDAAYVKVAAGETPALKINDPLADGMLSIGDKGAPVMALQTALYASGFKVDQDGDFGAMTRQAVMQFQRKAKLHRDGKVGKITGKALGLSFWG